MLRSSSCVPLTDTLARQHAHAHVLFVTFANKDSSEFAANWAMQLRTIGLDGLVGTVVELPEEHRAAISRAGSRVSIRPRSHRSTT